ncbi:hypothetical protein AJ79_08868 [Helicocarpus griseus UAMH5409]|uniref:Uncharacterized protein n=1 Tax=Helicocarpus griseus UAMH5409 TaxID=1447875 RepID=A0A2B7WPF3_9EURO|nr:hypothetical protein AJ79_08868 [Helicocarpus griseus UAMH5409]
MDKNCTAKRLEAKQSCTNDTGKLDGNKKKTLKSDIFALKEDLYDIKRFAGGSSSHTSSLVNELAYNRNRMARALEDSIFSVSPITFVRGVIELCNKVNIKAPPEFPLTVYDFWGLERDRDSLLKLAIVYGVPDWPLWKCYETRNPKEMLYKSLKEAIEAHPERCLRTLAHAWGLNFEKLQKPQSEEDYKFFSELQGKRKEADNIAFRETLGATYRKKKK